MEEFALRHRRTDDDEVASGLPTARADEVREICLQSHPLLHSDLILERIFLIEHGGEGAFLYQKFS